MLGSARVQAGATLALALLLPGAVEAQPGALVVDATVLEVQSDAPFCGDQAVAGWARVRVDAVRTPRRGLVPAELVVMVQCPEGLTVGEHWRFHLSPSQPARGTWPMFTVWPSSRSRSVAYWTVRTERIAAAP